MGFIKLSCKSCGAKLELTEEIDRFVCAHCGSEWIVNRSGGIVYLEIADDIKDIKESTKEIAQSIKAPVKDIFEAISLDDYDLVKKFIQKDAHTAYNKEKDYVPLGWAAHKGRERIMDLLISEGVDINAEYGKLAGFSTGWTILTNAITKGDDDAVELLILKGADLNKLQPLTFALSLKKHKIARILRKHGAQQGLGCSTVLWVVVFAIIYVIFISLTC